MSPELQSKADEACAAAKDFHDLFYSTFDKQRHKVAGLYLDDAVLVWNGNGFKGKQAITEFYLTIPPSKFLVKTLDAQPLQAPTADKSFAVTASGFVEFDNKGDTLFHQCFVLTADEQLKWKIVSDIFRFQETVTDWYNEEQRT